MGEKKRSEKVKGKREKHYLPVGFFSGKEKI